MSSYPLGQSEADTITSRTGKKLSQITLDEVKKGNVTADDIKISAETLKKQGQVSSVVCRNIKGQEGSYAFQDKKQAGEAEPENTALLFQQIEIGRAHV